jgi:hypothetical protein
MSSATLNRFRATCQAAGIPMSVIAQVVGVKPTSLSSALRDVMNLGSETDARLHTVSVRVLELREAFAPMRLPDDPVSLGKLVSGFEDGRISLDVIRNFVKQLLEQ